MSGRAVVAALSLLAALSAAPAARAEGRDGTYAGTIRCEALPGMRALRTAVTMTVEGDRVRYEREIHHPTGGPSGTFERGEGRVGPEGELTLTTQATGPAYAYEAEYRGRIEAETAQLTGAQRWKRRSETGTIVRPCTLDLRRRPP